MKSPAVFALIMRAAAFALLLHVVPATAGERISPAAFARDVSRDLAAGRVEFEKRHPSPQGDAAYVLMTVETWSRVEDLLARSARLIRLQRIELERLKRQAPRKECF